MSEDADEENQDDELGQVGEQVNGIANRFERNSGSETPETTKTADTPDTPEMSDADSSGAPQSGEMQETSETTKATQATSTTETPSPGDDEFQLREHWNGRTIYLPDDVVDDLDLRYQECNLEWQKQRGETLPKNERFYPAVVRAALGDTTIEAELGLDED